MLYEVGERFFSTPFYRTPLCYRTRRSPIFRNQHLLLINKATIPVNVQMTLIKFRIKSGSQCQWLTFLGRRSSIARSVKFLPARLARWRRAHEAGREPLSHSTGVTTQGESCLQTVDIARQLMRGGELHREAQTAE